MKNINENLLMRNPESNRLFQLTSAFVKIGAVYKAAFLLEIKGGRIVQQV